VTRPSFGTMSRGPSLVDGIKVLVRYCLSANKVGLERDKSSGSILGSFFSQLYLNIEFGHELTTWRPLKLTLLLTVGTKI
jgi:hypothetical protein